MLVRYGVMDAHPGDTKRFTLEPWSSAWNQKGSLWSHKAYSGTTESQLEAVLSLEP
jgi:hypothetical protein